MDVHFCLRVVVSVVARLPGLDEHVGQPWEGPTLHDSLRITTSSCMASIDLPVLDGASCIPPSWDGIGLSNLVPEVRRTAVTLTDVGVPLPIIAPYPSLYPMHGAAAGVFLESVRTSR